MKMGELKVGERYFWSDPYGLTVVVIGFDTQSLGQQIVIVETVEGPGDRSGEFAGVRYGLSSSQIELLYRERR